MISSNEIKSTRVFESSSKHAKQNTNYHLSSNGGGSFDSYSNPKSSHIAGLYDFEGTIGQGHFAVVKLARHVFSGEKVAIKVIDKHKLDEISREHLFQEVKCMKLVQHPNVVRLYEVIDTAAKLYLILELGDGGDMYDYIMKHSNGLSEQKSKNYFRQIVRAIKYCHDLHVVHRDLKPENVVFFEQTGQVKLTDFGFSNVFVPGTKLYTSCGSLAYSAPEILLGDSYDAPAVDVWSLGVILYMLATGRAPFQEANDSETLTMILDCKYYLPAHVSLECNDLISRMLVREPEQRIKLDEITNHAWLREQSDEDEDNDHEDQVDKLSHHSSDTTEKAIDENGLTTENDDQDADDEVEIATKRLHNKLNFKENHAPTKRKRHCGANDGVSSRDKLLKKYIPLIKRENLSENDNNEIIENMISGRIASKEEIIKALDEDKYNYITATYYLLAEKLLRKQFQKRTKRKLNSNSSQSIKLPFNDSTSSQHQINDSHLHFNNLGQFKSIPSAGNTTPPTSTAAATPTTASSVIPTSSNTSKANYANSKSMRNKLIRQDEANEIAECDEEEDDEQVTLQSNLIANAVKIVEEAKQDQDIIMMSTQAPLTNILEDEEELVEEEEPTLQFKNDLNSCLINTAMTGGGSISSNSNPSIMSNSRRSSRGGEATNTIAALTILEEVESDHVSVNSFNNGTVRMSNSKLKLYPYSNKQPSDESLTRFAHDLAITEENQQLNNNFSSSSADKLNSQETSKNRIKLFTTKVPSSGADTSSDTSDNELRNIAFNTNKEIKDFDWNRSASSSSRSRSKSSRHTTANNLAVLNEQQRQRPLSISSDQTNHNTNNKEDSSVSLKHEHFNFRTKSLADESHLLAINYLNQNGPNRPYLSVSSSNSNDHLSANNFPTAPTGSIGKSLSVEHRIANMSQMSINSQLSKNNSLRFPNRSGACDTPVQHLHQHSTTPTPRESIVFNRGDEKPIAKILLSQHHQLKSQNSADFALLNNQLNSLSSNSSTPRSSFRGSHNNNQSQPVTPQPLLNTKKSNGIEEYNENLIDSKRKSLGQTRHDEAFNSDVLLPIQTKMLNVLTADQMQDQMDVSKSLKSMDSTLSLTSNHNNNNNNNSISSINHKVNTENTNLLNTPNKSSSMVASVQSNPNTELTTTSLFVNEKQHIIAVPDDQVKQRKQKKKKNSNQSTIQKSDIDLFEKKSRDSFSVNNSSSNNTNNKLHSAKTCTKCCTII